MNTEKLKLIVRNLESLVECLKSEIQSDDDTYKNESEYKNIVTYLEDYDEVFCEGDEDE
jgi:hypothetical protein